MIAVNRVFDSQSHSHSHESGSARSDAPSRLELLLWFGVHYAWCTLCPKSNPIQCDSRSTLLYCIVLKSTLLHCTVLHCIVMYRIVMYCNVPSCAIVTVRVKQCTVLDTTINDCSTTAPLALVQILLSVATALACHETVCGPISCNCDINLHTTGTIKWICGRRIPTKK